MTELDQALATFLAPLVHVVSETYTWPLAQFAVKTYRSTTLPPLAAITSVRAVVLQDDKVLLVRDPDGYHILPGGRRETGESLAETLIREVLEETGWQVTVGDLLGCKHFHRLTAPPTAIAVPQSDFVQLVYVAHAVAYCPEAREQGGYELGADFVPLAQLDRATLAANEQLFLQAALHEIE